MSESEQPGFVYVEDESFSREVMQMLMVRGLGYQQFVIFEDSQDFIKRLDALPFVPEVIFLDIHVQPHNGFDMLQMLRESPRYQQTRIIALTASVMNEEVNMLKTAGFDGGIAKPLDQETFGDTLHQILQGQEIWHIV